MRATIREVSEAAGVSIKTVSRVLNKERYVREDTRKRVEDAVERLGYRPSAAARMLAGRRSFQIGLLCDNPGPQYIYETQAGARDRCQSGGYRMIYQPCDTGSEKMVAEVMALIDETHVDGLILSPPVSDHALLLAALDQRGIPYARIAPGDQQDRAPSVEIDDAAAAREMTQRLIALGHRRVAFVLGPADHLASQRRAAGYRAALSDAGIALDDALVVSGRFDFPSGRTAAEQLLDLGPAAPTAIFAGNDAMAAGVLAVAHERGISVPHDLSIVGFDDFEVAQMVWPPLTTVRQPIRELSAIAAGFLIEGA